MAYLGPTSTMKEIMGIPEAVAVIDKYMPGFSPYFNPKSPTGGISLQRILASYPPEIGNAFLKEIETISSDKLHGGQIMAKALKKEGVEKVFTLSGDHTMAMYYGLVEEGIEVIDFRHESAVIQAAMGYSHASGKPAVCIVTAGPGASNAIGAMVDAWVEGIPVFLISGGHPYSANQTGAMQEIDQIPLFRGITKWADRVYDTSRIADYVHIGFRHMMNPNNRGPVFMEIPFDVINDVTDAKCAYHCASTRVVGAQYGDPVQAERAAELLANAKKPVLVVGRESIYYPSNKEYVTKLCDYMMMPVAAMFEAKGFVGNERNNPQYQLGLMATAFADVIILLNVTPDYMFSSLSSPAYNPLAKFICINTNPNLIGMNRDFEVGIVGTPGEVCKQIYEKLVTLRDQQTDPVFLQEIGAMAQGMAMADAANVSSEAIPINPKRAGRDIGTFVSENTEWTFVCDGGDATSNVTANVVADRSSKFIFGGRYGGIGYGLPAAIGAHCATGGKVLLATGDGSFGFYMGEIVTAIGRNIPLVIVMLNDSCWGMIKGMEYVMHANCLLGHEKDHKYGVALNLPEKFRYDKMVEGAGGYGELVTDPNDIVPAIKRAEASGKVSLINVIISDITSPGSMSMGTDMFGKQFKEMVKF
jgi:acetolactate synthase-1/2/3 large subunit